MYSFIRNMYTITIQFKSWVQIDTWRKAQQDEVSLVTALYWNTSLLSANINIIYNILIATVCNGEI